MIEKCCDEREDEDDEKREEEAEDEEEEEEEDGRRRDRRLGEICPCRRSPAVEADPARLEAEAQEESIAVDKKER